MDGQDRQDVAQQGNRSSEFLVVSLHARRQIVTGSNDLSAARVRGGPSPATMYGPFANGPYDA